MRKISWEMPPWVALVVGISIGFVLSTAPNLVEAAPEGYPWYNTASDVRGVFNQQETAVYEFVTARLIEMKDHPNTTVQDVGDSWLQQFLEEFGLIAVGADPSLEPKFSADRARILELLLKISDPDNGGNGQAVFDTMVSTIIIVEPLE